jgi:hypothetical protein
MGKGNKTIIYIGIYAVVAYGVYAYFFSKKSYAKIIANSGNYSLGVEELIKFETPYLKAWSKAVKNGQPSFVINGITYNTKGGRKQK